MVNSNPLSRARHRDRGTVVSSGGGSCCLRRASLHKRNDRLKKCLFLSMTALPPSSGPASPRARGCGVGLGLVLSHNPRAPATLSNHHVLPQRRVAVRPHRLVPRQLPRRFSRRPSSRARRAPNLVFRWPYRSSAGSGGDWHAWRRTIRPDERPAPPFGGALWCRRRCLGPPPLLGRS
jgi:hypothetical protein